MLGRRQINVQRENLASMCRISVKSLLDYACLYTHVDDDCEEFINFCAVFEQLVSHRLRPYQKKVWLPGQGSPRHFWDVLLDSYNKTRGFPLQSCIPNIEAIETFKSPKAKLRAFIRVALMEKRLSDYMFWLLDNSSLICESYLDGAILSSEEAAVLCGDLIGLNAIDFNFCLKGNENELLGPLEISYSPFLKYKQTLASQCSDDIEMLRLSGKDIEEEIHPGSILTDNNINDILRLQSLEKNVNHIKEQKDYLEELVRLQERQIKDANVKMENMKADHKLAEREWEQECSTMDACVLELQAELGKIQKQNESLKFQVHSLKQFKQRLEMTDVPLVDMAMAEDRDVNRADRFVQMEQVEDRFGSSRTTRKKKPNHIPSDQRSIISLVSDQTSLQEDSQSMIPLAGSLADVSVSDSEAKEYSKGMTFSKGQDYPTDILRMQAQMQSGILTHKINLEQSSGEEKEQDQNTQNSEVLIQANMMMADNKYIELEEHLSGIQDNINVKADKTATHLEAKGSNLNNNSKQQTVTQSMAEDDKIISEIVGDNWKDNLELDTAVMQHVENLELKQKDNSKLEIAISDSYVVMESEEGKEEVIMDPLQAQSFENSADGEVTMDGTSIREGGSARLSEEQDNTAAAFEDRGNVECGREEEAVMSEPEIVNPSNASSGSSEGAWEMLSDSEQGEGRGEN